MRDLVLEASPVTGSTWNLMSGAIAEISESNTVISSRFLSVLPVCRVSAKELILTWQSFVIFAFSSSPGLAARWSSTCSGRRLMPSEFDCISIRGLCHARPYRMPRRRLMRRTALYPRQVMPYLSSNTLSHHEKLRFSFF